MAVQDYKINYKSDFVLNINGDAGWAVPFCIKFWTGMPSQAYFVGFDGVKYVNCRVGDTPTQLMVMLDDHHLPIGKLMMQIAYHTTIEEFPGSVFDEVTNARDVIVTIDGTDYQVMLDFTGEDAPELEFDLPAYANEAERIQNELQRQQNEAARIAAELQREQATAAAVQGAENVNAQLNGTTLIVTNRNGVSTSVNTKGERGERGPVGPEGPQGEQGVSIVSFRQVYASETATYYSIAFSDGHEQSVAIPKGAKGDTGATGPQGPQGPQGQTGVSITGFVETGETETATLYNITFSNGTTQQVAIPKGEKGDQGPQGPVGPQGPMGDVAVITPEQQASFTMYSEPGQNTNGPMTQKAVTDGICINESQIILTTLFSWATRKYISGTDSAGQQLGSEQSSSAANSKASGYVDISGFNRIEITLPRFGSSTNSPGACFYDENHVAISGMWKAEDTPASTMGEYTFGVPSGAKFVRATSRTDFGNFNCIGYVDKKISDDIVNLDEQFEKAAYLDNNKIYITDFFNWTQRLFVLGKDGAANTYYTGMVIGSSSSNSYASDYVDISGYDYIRITLPQMNDSTVAPGACFYDENYIPIMGMCVTEKSPVGMVMHEYKIPSNAKYIRATKRTDSGWGSFLCYLYKNVSVSETLSTHNNKETNITDLFAWVSPSAYISQINGSSHSSSSSNSFASGKVDVSSYNQLRIKLPLINSEFSQAGWAFYDGSGNYLSGCAIADAEAESNTMIEKIINVPRNAKYFASTWRKDNGATFYCYGIESEQEHSYNKIANVASEYIESHASVKDFGCIGDGVMDDTHAFKNALASGVKKLYIPSGTYLLGQTMVVPSGMELYGDGIGKSILHYLPAKNNSLGNESITNAYTPYTWRNQIMYSLMQAVGQNVLLHDFELEAEDIDSPDYQFIGISMYGLTDSKMENISVHDINYRINHVTPSSGNGCFGNNIYIWNESKRIVVEHCVSYNGGYENIGTEDTEDVTISYSYFGNGWRTSLQIHRGSKRTKVVNNTIDNYNPTIAHASLTIHGVSGNPIEDLYISNNTIHSITDENQGLRGGIELVQAGYQNVFITNNSMDGNSYAIVDLLDDGESASWPNNLFFINNRVKNSRYGICLKRGNNYIVKNNVIDTVNTAIELKATRYICKDNILVDNTTKTLSGTEWVDS